MNSNKNNFDLIDDLINLKNKIQLIEEDFINKKNIINERENQTIAMKDSLYKAVTYHKNRNTQMIKLNVGGTIFITTKDSLLNIENTLFEAIIKDPEFSDNYIKYEELFFDRSPEYFGYILNYIRTGKINYNMFNDNSLKLILEEARYYNILSIVEYIITKLGEVSIKCYKFNGPYIYEGQVAGTNLLKDIFDSNLNEGAICCNMPAEIIFELNCNWIINEIKIGGFTGNEKLWYPGNGVGANISCSIDGTEWINVGKIPTDFDKEIKSITFNKINAKYIKFSYYNYIGIAYLSISKFK